MKPEVAGPRLNELAEQKEFLESRLEELEVSRSLALTEDKILEYLQKTGRRSSIEATNAPAGIL